MHAAVGPDVLLQPLVIPGQLVLAIVPSIAAEELFGLGLFLVGWPPVVLLVAEPSPAAAAAAAAVAAGLAPAVAELVLAELGPGVVGQPAAAAAAAELAAAEPFVAAGLAAAAAAAAAADVAVVLFAAVGD